MLTYEVLTLYLRRDRMLINNMRKDIKAKLKEMPEPLTIGQVAEVFSIHPDTLRNWEKEGILVPMRVGTRKIENTAHKTLKRSWIKWVANLLFPN